VSNSLEEATPSSNLAGSRPTSIPPPETPLKSIFSASPFLAPTVDDHQFWSLHEGGGGAATPTRGLIIESDFDFQIINGAANWIPQDEEVNWVSFNPMLLVSKVLTSMSLTSMSYGALHFFAHFTYPFFAVSFLSFQMLHITTPTPPTITTTFVH